ncbi:hypothetical protein HD553DRAFT_346397 [Filobasidium floriforme]|uniref:uncharacterized protein n=1 Tax=Filobasidium floriforme TaxID=5210 RepID=UPI001E8CB5B4|nr:uncharacterized protein HD553DRAFT_346397 [Filobasidium floriforme]KAH8078016.1 hypothetical protein HD553DRAFT_346397 [Filobasidium floriforme]
MSLAHNNISEPVAEKDFALELEAFSDAVFSVKQAWKDAITNMQSSYPIEAGSLQVGYKKYLDFIDFCQKSANNARGPVYQSFVQTVVADAKDSTASIDDKIESSKDFYTSVTPASSADWTRKDTVDLFNKLESVMTELMTDMVKEDQVKSDYMDALDKLNDLQEELVQLKKKIEALLRSESQSHQALRAALECFLLLLAVVPFGFEKALKREMTKYGLVPELFTKLDEQTELLQHIAIQRKKVQALKSKKTAAVTRAQQLAAHVETVKQIQSDFSDVAPKMTQLGAFQDAIRSTVEVWEQFLESPDSADAKSMQDAVRDLVATQELYEPINQALTGFVMRVDL